MGLYHTTNMFQTKHDAWQLARKLALIEDTIFNAHFDNQDNEAFQNLINEINKILISE